MDEKLSLLKRFFKNRYSRNDYLKLKEMAHSQGDVLEKHMQLHWNEFEHGGKKEKQFNNFFGTTRSNSKGSVRNLFATFSRIAAILVIPLLIAIGYLYFEFDEYLSQKDVFVEVSSPVGARTSVNLPDGSKVWLNGESSIKYPAVFNKNRKVEISGEVAFKVKSDIQNPFLVKAKDVFVKATGTEFNVFAYEDDPDINVILKEGRVYFLNESQEILKKIEPGYQLNYKSQSKKIHYSQARANDYMGWVNGKLIFRNSSFSEVVKRMEHWYGVNIEVLDKELLNLHFKATFVDESIEEALKLLQTTATFNYCFSKRRVKPDGNLEDSKIYITKR